jgi:hypothetical protein
MQRLFAESEKWLMTCVQEKRHEAGALELIVSSNFLISQSLVRGSSQQRCGFKPSSTRSGSGPLNNVIEALFHFNGGSYVFALSVLQYFATVHFLFTPAGFGLGSYDDHCAYQRCRMTFCQTTINWREGIGSLKPGHGPGFETASRAHMLKR